MPNFGAAGAAAGAAAVAAVAAVVAAGAAAGAGRFQRLQRPKTEKHPPFFFFKVCKNISIARLLVYFYFVWESYSDFSARNLAEARRIYRKHITLFLSTSELPLAKMPP